MKKKMQQKVGRTDFESITTSITQMYNLLSMNRNNSMPKDACSATIENEATSIRFAYAGTYKYKTDKDQAFTEISGSGHHGPDYVGVASLRAGKGYRVVSQPVGTRMM